MPDDNLYLVFSKPPEGVSKEEYDRWYHAHVRENIVSPGFVSARRFALESVPQGPPIPFSHLALYEYEGSMSTWRTDLTRRIEVGDVVLPEWFPQITFGSWSCTPIDERSEPVR